MLDWDSKGLDTVGGCYEAAVTECLFLEILILFYFHLLVAPEFLIPLNRAEIGSTE